jgi:hypothetical protein
MLLGDSTLRSIRNAGQGIWENPSSGVLAIWVALGIVMQTGHRCPAVKWGARYGRTTLTVTSGPRWPTAHNFAVPGAQRAGNSQVGMAVRAG